MTPRYRVTLSEDERSRLEGLTRCGKTAAHTFIHARALLLCDAGPHGCGWKLADVAQALGVTARTIEHLKERFVEEGIEAALQRKPRAKPPKISFDGAFDARLTTLAWFLPRPAPAGAGAAGRSPPHPCVPRGGACCRGRALARRPPPPPPVEPGGRCVCWPKRSWNSRSRRR